MFVSEEAWAIIHDSSKSEMERYRVIASIDVAIARAAHPRYTCPMCRIRIKHRPVPVYALKQIQAKLAGLEVGDERAYFSSSVWNALFPVDIKELFSR